METKVVEVVSQSLSVTMSYAEWRAVLVEPGRFLKALRAELAGMAKARIGDDPRQLTLGRRERPKGTRRRGDTAKATTMTCNVCGASFKHRKRFETHVQKHQSADDAAG